MAKAWRAEKRAWLRWKLRWVLAWYKVGLAAVLESRYGPPRRLRAAPLPDTDDMENEPLSPEMAAAFEAAEGDHGEPW